MIVFRICLWAYLVLNLAIGSIGLFTDGVRYAMLRFAAAALCYLALRGIRTLPAWLTGEGEPGCPEEFTDEQLEELSIHCWNDDCPAWEVDRLIDAYKALRDRDRDRDRVRVLPSLCPPDAWQTEQVIPDPEELARIRAAFTPEEWDAMYRAKPFSYTEQPRPLEPSLFIIDDPLARTEDEGRND